MTEEDSAVDAFIALGGNLGDVLATFRGALEVLRADLSGLITVRSVAPAYRTVAMTAPGAGGCDPDYWNSVVGIRTGLSARALLRALLGIEQRFGRERHGRWRPRTLDIDLLLFGTETICESELMVPHPGLADRLFVLRPLCDIAPEAPLPGGNTAADLLARHSNPDYGILERLPDWDGCSL